MINSAARRTCTVGEIVNLVSADTQKLMDFVVYFNAVWLAPIEIALCLFFLWQVWRAFAISHSPIACKGLDANSCSVHLATRAVSVGGDRHRHFHFPTQWIHRQEKKQTTGTKKAVGSTVSCHLARWVKMPQLVYMAVETEWVFGQNGAFPVIPLMPAPSKAFQKQWKESVGSGEAQLLYSFGKNNTTHSETSDAGLIEHES